MLSMPVTRTTVLGLTASTVEEEMDRSCPSADTGGMASLTPSSPWTLPVSTTSPLVHSLFSSAVPAQGKAGHRKGVHALDPHLRKRR